MPEVDGLQGAQETGMLYAGCIGWGAPVRHCAGLKGSVYRHCHCRMGRQMLPHIADIRATRAIRAITKVLLGLCTIKNGLIDLITTVHCIYIYIWVISNNPDNPNNPNNPEYNPMLYIYIYRASHLGLLSGSRWPG